MLAIWETTRACDLACRHCRASADPERNPDELSTAEGMRLLDKIREAGDPLVVLTGGDPLKRPDLYELLAHSVKIGLRTTVSPSPTPLLTPAAIQRFKDVGVARMSISVDGADAEAHDAFRGVDGSFDLAIRALTTAREVGLETQINTTVTRLNWRRLGEIAQLVEQTGAAMWDVFFLVPTGRGQTEDELNADEYEEVFAYLYEISKTTPFAIKTTEAMHYRRFVARKRKEEGKAAAPPPGPMSRMRGINSGRGFVFISRTGDVFPSGFLPLKAGNVKTDDLLEVYRNGPVFQQLRDSDELGGKCGYCPYHNLCGGSRARAYALTGDHMAAEPRCNFQPNPPAESHAA
jgi:radical SAM protein